MTARTKTPAEPPHSREAEISTLGTILINDDVFDSVAAEFSGLDQDALFHDPACGALWEMMLILRAKEKPIDYVCIMALASERPDSGVDASFLAHLHAAVPTSANAVVYAREVVEKYRLRMMQRIGQRLLAGTVQAGADAQALMLAAVDDFGALNRAGRTALRSVADGLEDSISRITELFETGSSGGLLTGFHGIDRVLNGLDAGTVCVVGARPSIGKTGFALNLADNVARDGHNVLIFSIEMPKAQLDDRLVYAAGQIEKAKVIDQFYSRDALVARLQDAVKQSHFGRIFVDDSPRLSHFDLSSRAKAFKRERPLGLLVVDYLQLIAADNSRANREAQVADASRAIKALAKEMKCPVILLSQLNREAERDGEPNSAHLRESGSIEQDADVIMLLSRGEGSLIRVNISKNRNGPKALVGLAYDRDTQKFRDWNGPMGQLSATGTRANGIKKPRYTAPIEATYDEDPDEAF